MLKRTAGAAMIVFGIVLIGWVGYRLLFERSEGGRGPFGAIGFSAGLLIVGWKWAMDK